MKKSSENRPQKKSSFQIAWLNNPTFKDWIEGIPNNRYKVYCKFCKSQLYAHRYSVVKHCATSKHQENTKKFRKESISQLSTENIPMTIKVQEEQGTDNSLEIESNVASNSTINNEIEEKHTSCTENVESMVNATEDTTRNQEDIINSNEFYELDLIEEDNVDEIIYEDEEENNWPENCSQYEEVLLSPVQSDTEEMELKKTTISTHILDTTRGRPAANVPVTLFQLNGDEWKQISRCTTNSDGRCPTLISKEDFIPGCYKLHFDVLIYLKETATTFLYPFIEIAFQCEEGQHYHIPLLLNPFGYSTYRGS